MLRAIDIQHVLVQSNSMERVQQTQQQHPDQQQRYLDIQGKEEKKLSKEMVKNTDEPDHARVQENRNTRVRNATWGDILESTKKARRNPRKSLKKTNTAES